MKHTVWLDAAAEWELNEAAHYYRSIDARLAEQFLEDFEHARGILAGYPLASPVVFGRIRRKPLQKFPYTLYYDLSEEPYVRIFAVAHDKRHPTYWLERSKT